MDSHVDTPVKIVSGSSDAEPRTYEPAREVLVRK
jgi:hypothetical protein